MNGPGVYYVVADNRGIDYLVIEIHVDGPARVVGRWDEKRSAENDAQCWTRIAEMDMAA